MKHCAALVVLSGCAVAVAACGTIAGLGDYELASQDAAVGDGSTGDVGPGGGDDGGADTAEANAGNDGDAGAIPDSSGDAVGNDGAVEAGADAHADGPAVPPTDKYHVPCGSDTCNVPAEECCEQPDASTCQFSGGNCSGVVAHCDETANCQQGNVCCVTSLSPSGLETECRLSCSVSNPQSCRTDGECGGMGPCVAWMCAGTVVATCGGAGSGTGGH